MARPIQTEFERMINRIVLAIRKYDTAKTNRPQVETGIAAALTIHYETAAKANTDLNAKTPGREGARGDE